jgi:PX domain-containing protein kinase-like protein
LSGVNLPIPPKKLFGSTDKGTVSLRQQGLQEFLDAVVAHPLLQYELFFQQFINPKEFMEDLPKQAMRNVSMFFRSQPDQVMEQQIFGFGWRIKKHFFLMSAKGKSKSKKVLSWMEPGPDMCLSEKEVEASIRVLSSLQHPNIVTAESVWYSSNGLLVIRPFEPRGSLRDLLYGSSPLGNWVKKYCLPSTRPVPPRDIASYGRQILEGLKYLNDKGFFLGHVHLGNVLVDANNNCQLTELENSLMGQPSIYRPYMVKTKKVRSTELQAVYSFGHLLYELCVGRPLGAAYMETDPSAASPALLEILCQLLTQEKVKEGLPSLSTLIEADFFKKAWYSPGTEKPVLKVGSKLREVLKNARELNEQRLYQDQKKMAQQRRMEKTTTTKTSDSSLMSEEEKKKKYKHKKKHASAPTEEEEESYPTTMLQQPTKTSSTTSSSSSTTTHKTSSSSGSKSSSSKKSSSKSSSKSTQPPPAPGAPPPPAPPPPPPPTTSGSSERGALLSSIHTFSKKGLKKAVTNDRSAPKV